MAIPGASIGGFAMLYVLASLKGRRRGTLRFAAEQAALDERVRARLAEGGLLWAKLPPLDAASTTAVRVKKAEAMLLGQRPTLQLLQDAAMEASILSTPVADARGSVAYKKDMARVLTLRGLKIVVDAAHGAAYQIAPKVFHELGAEVIAIGCAPDGLNINHEVGATHPQALIEAVKAHGADYGIALDGDADRLQLVDATGSSTGTTGSFPKTIRCPYHGWTYGPDGVCTSIPARSKRSWSK